MFNVVCHTSDRECRRRRKKLPPLLCPFLCPFLLPPPPIKLLPTTATAAAVGAGFGTVATAAVAVAVAESTTLALPPLFRLKWLL